VDMSYVFVCSRSGRTLRRLRGGEEVPGGSAPSMSRNRDALVLVVTGWNKCGEVVLCAAGPPAFSPAATIIGLMVSLLFRVKASWSPRDDITIGANRSLEDLQEAINVSFGLDFDHLWFMAKGQEYWGSPVKYRSPTEFEHPDPWDDVFEFFGGKVEEKRNAAEVTLGELELAVGDRLCYVFDYGDEWRFYMILRKVNEVDSSDLESAEVKRRGGDIVQYAYDEDE